MNTHTLQTDLSQFSGTLNYYRVMPRLVITDGVEYLARVANCYWLISAIYSHLVTEPIRSVFVVAKLTVSESVADLSLEDGNGRLLSSQHIEYTDFPLTRIDLYCCYESRTWVLLLPTEY